MEYGVALHLYSMSLSSNRKPDPSVGGDRRHEGCSEVEVAQVLGNEKVGRSNIQKRPG